MAENKIPPHPVLMAVSFGLACATFPLLYFATKFALTPIGFLTSYGVLYCIFIYRVWNLVQGSSLKAKKPTPGKAVGFLFIPFFNFYWLFVARVNCAKHINYLRGNNAVSVGLCIAECILIIVAPFVVVIIELFSNSTPLISVVPFVGLMISQKNNFAFYRAAKDLLRQPENMLRRPALPPILPWEALPSITVCVFGPIESVSGLEHIEKALREYLQVLSIPDKSELGATDKPSRLGCKLWEIEGEILLLLEPGATISTDDAKRILNVLSEFVNERVMLVQGRGYHAFVRRKALEKYEFCREGRLSDHCERWGFSWRRVDYLTIDPRSNHDYEW